MTVKDAVCRECLASVAPGSGKYVNRVPVIEGEGNWICESCDSQESNTMTYEELDKYVPDGPFKELVKKNYTPEDLARIPPGWMIFARTFYLAGVKQGREETKLTEETS